MKDKLRKIEADQAEKMVSVALKLDPNAEIEKRFRDMKRQVEESSDVLESARSFNVSHSGVPSDKKKVQFASPDKYRSSVIDEQSSGKYSNNKYEDSIGEDIGIEDSYAPSVSNQTS